jgi:hypothetical protein
MTGPSGPFFDYSSFNEARASQLASTMTVILHRLFEQTPDGLVRHCGFTGPSLEEEQIDFLNAYEPCWLLVEDEN